MRCPTCRQDVAPPASHRPFCSERCRLVDLGHWLDGSYTVPGEPASESDLESGPDAGPDPDDPGFRRRH